MNHTGQCILVIQSVDYFSHSQQQLYSIGGLLYRLALSLPSSLALPHQSTVYLAEERVPLAHQVVRLKEKKEKPTANYKSTNVQIFKWPR